MLNATILFLFLGVSSMVYFVVKGVQDENKEQKEFEEELHMFL